MSTMLKMRSTSRSQIRRQEPPGVLLMGLSAVIQVEKFETRRVEANDSEIRIETR